MLGPPRYEIILEEERHGEHFNTLMKLQPEM